MNEFLSWTMLHNRPWDTQPRLTDAETDELFELMADPSLDEDAMTIDMADGYMTAIAAGPSPVLTHLWLEDIFAQPTLPLPHDPARQQRLLQLLLHRYTDIQAALAVRPAEALVEALYMPLSSEVAEGDCITPYQLDAQGDRIGDWELKDWAEGFRRAVATDDEWEPLMAAPQAAALLGPVVLYSMGYNPDRPEFQLEAESAELRPALVVSVYAMRDWWRDYRRTLWAPREPAHRARHPQSRPQRPLPLRQRRKVQEMLRRVSDMPARQIPEAPAALPTGLRDGLHCWIAQGRQRALRAPVLLCSAHWFAVGYKLVLPSEEELRAEPERERSELLAQQGTS